MKGERPRGPVPALGAALVSLIFNFFVCLWPARGLTFMWDDWDLLARLAHGSRPGAWLAPVGEHSHSVPLVLLDVERFLFGGNHTLFLAVSWALHGVNVYLLARVLEEWTEDPRAAALAATLFGIACGCRAVFWWVTDVTEILCFTAILAGMLAFERARRRVASEPVAPPLALVAPVVGLVLAMVVGALSWAGGFTLGPLVVVAALLLLQGRARRDAVALAGVTTALLLLLRHALSGGVEDHLPRTGSQIAAALRFAAELVGFAFQRMLRLPNDVTEASGVVYATAFVLLLSVLTRVVPERLRRRVLLALAATLIPAGLVSVGRWSLVDDVHRGPAFSHYHYTLWLGLGAFAALGLTTARGRWPRGTPVGALLVLALLGLFHAAAARADRSGLSPYERHRYNGAAIVAHLDEAAKNAGAGVIYDAGLPMYVAWRTVRAHDLIAVIDPGVSCVWTSTASAESLRWLEADPLLREKLELPPPR